MPTSISDLFNVNMPDPTAIQQQEQDQQTALQSQGPQGQNLAAVLNFGGKLGGNPQLAKAQALQTAMHGAMAEMPSQPEPGQDDIDYNLTRLQKMRDAALPIDPNLANQLNTNMLRLQNERVERTKLQADSRMENSNAAAVEQNTAQNKRTPAQQAGSTMAYVYKDGKFDSFDLSNPANAPAFDKAKGMPGAVVMSNSDRQDFLKQQIASDQVQKLASIKAAAQAPAFDYDDDTMNNLALLTLSNPNLIPKYAPAGKASEPFKSDLANRQNAYLKAAGLNGSDLAQIQAQIKAQAGNAAAMQKSLGMTTAFETLAKANGDRVLSLANKISTIPGVSDLPVSQAIARGIDKHLLNSADAAELSSVLQTFQTETARIIAGNPNMTGVLTDTARKEIEDVVNGNASAEVLTRVINRLKTEMEIRRMGLSNSLSDAINSSVALRPNADGSFSTPALQPPPGNVPSGTSGGIADLARQELERRKNGSK